MVKPAIPTRDPDTSVKPSRDAQPADQTPMLGRYLTSQRPIGPRSSLFMHTIPPFYACYLLKSIQTPTTTTVYIGSTPSPPRRIRQHNGELTAGAKKTSRKRPWVMQMIVYGFPSRLAALQFEWAWQHPHKSRHLRDENGTIFGSRRSFLMNKNVEIVQGMISRYPFSTWPLHVKLFTPDAVKFWDAATRKSKTPLPIGFTCSVELEGVDGKSGLVGSGRVGPIRADDDDFAAAIMVKHTALVASGKTPTCSICDEPLHTYATDPLHSTLCPTSGCVTTSHLTCLSRHFLHEQKGEMPGLVPRGGHCKGCGEYTLWGDVIRGCYRRLPSRDAEEHPDVATDDMYESDEDDGEIQEVLMKPKGRKASTKKGTSPTAAKRKGKAKAVGVVGSGASSGTAEYFDLDNISSTSSEDSNATPMVHKRLGRPRKADANMTTTPVPFLLPTESTVTKTRLVKTAARVMTPRQPPATAQPLGSPIILTNNVEVFDLTDIASSPEVDSLSSPKRKRGRPQKNVSGTSTTDQPSPSKKRYVLDPVGLIHEASPAHENSSSSNKLDDFDFSNIASNSEGVGAHVVVPEPKQRGRPRKNSGTAAPSASSSPLISRASATSKTARRSGGASVIESPSFARPYHQQSTSTSTSTSTPSTSGATPSHPRHRDVHFQPRSPEGGVPGSQGDRIRSFGTPEPKSFIDPSDGGYNHYYYDYGLDCDYGSDSGVMHYSPPRTPERADRHRQEGRPSTPPSTGGLTRAMAGLSTSGGSPSKPSSSQRGTGLSTWNKHGLPVIEISD